MPTIHIRVSEELLEALDGKAAEEGRTRAAMGERLLNESLGAVKRMPRITGGKVEKATLPELVESGTVTTADKIEKKVRPTAICEHKIEYRFCRVGTCVAALAGE